MAEDFVIRVFPQKSRDAKVNSRESRSIIMETQETAGLEETSPSQILCDISNLVVPIDQDEAQRGGTRRLVAKRFGATALEKLDFIRVDSVFLQVPTNDFELVGEVLHRVHHQSLCKQHKQPLDAIKISL